MKTAEAPESVTPAADDGSQEIRYVPFESKHIARIVILTLKEFPFPENILCSIGFLAFFVMFGVVALDNEDRVAGYFLGLPPLTICVSRKKVANLTIVCVSSNHQKRGIAKSMGKYMMEGKHPDFSPDDYEEILIQDTDVWNSPSWLFSDRTGFRYCPTHDMISRYGILGYLQILCQCHMMPCQFMKRYTRTEEEKQRADALETQKGIIACLISGILPAVYWIVHWVLRCGESGIRGSFVGCVIGVTYFLLAARFGLAHLLTSRDPSIPPVVFREYDTWWSPFSIGWPATIFGGVPLLGWTGGFYFGAPGLNYLKEENRRALGLLYLPINLFTLGLFLMHTLLRIFAPAALLVGGGVLDVLGTAAFFCSITDLAMVFEACPNGAMAIRRWKFWLFVVLLLSWLAVLLISILVPSVDGTAPDFLDLSAAACKAA